MRRRSFESKFSLQPKLVFALILVGLLGLFVRFTSPKENIAAVVGFILLATLLAYTASSFFLSKKYSILSAVFTFLFFVISYVVGFQLLNTMLLLSFIIGIAILIK